ncbi:MAG: hypothetical protein H0Z24_05725 [Thermosipho sp. (in: Bacteria)]|nr:hypothetical protein [Thermosipho sp. (in: thermotogales)]
MKLLVINHIQNNTYALKKGKIIKENGSKVFEVDVIKYFTLVDKLNKQTLEELKQINNVDKVIMQEELLELLK